MPREVKNSEYRVAITPAGTHELVRAGHDVVVESGAGEGSAIPDADYVAAGAKILRDPADVWDAAELVLKVKEPVTEEFGFLRRGQVLFTFLHLAASADCTTALVEAGTTAIAYETVQRDDGSLPLLAPMSEVAGRMAPQVGARCLEREAGGRGILMGGVPGVYPANVVVIGAGVAGTNAAAIAAGMRADVTVLDTNVQKLRDVEHQHAGAVRTVASNAYELEKACLSADLVIGAVLVPGARAPRLVDDDLVGRMRPGSVLVDLAVDQGGCFESSRPTTHESPTFIAHGSVFYCVANMPGAVPHTSTYALTNVTLRYALDIANNGWRRAAAHDPALARGVNVSDGAVTYGPVADAHGLPFRPVTGMVS